MFAKKAKNEISSEYAGAEIENGDYKIKRNKTLDNIMLIVSLFAALALWIYVYNSTNTTEEMSFDLITIDKKNADTLFEDYDLVVQYMNIDTINVSVMGSKDAMSTVERKDIKAYINLSGISEAKEYSLDVVVDVPEGLTCVSQTVYKVEVTVDRSTSKEFPIGNDSIMLNGWSLENGYTIGKYSTNIGKVTLEGASNDIAKVSTVGVSTVPLGNLKNNMKTNCTLVLLDKDKNIIDLPGLRVSADKVTIEVEIEIIKSREVAVKVQTEHGFVPEELISLSTSKVTVSGNPDRVNEISEIVLGKLDEKKLSVSQVYKNDYQLSIDGIEITDAQGKKVEKISLSVDMSKLPSRTLEGVNVYNGEEIVGTIDITLVAKKNNELYKGMLNQINAEDIKVHYIEGVSTVAVELSPFHSEYVFECENVFVPEEVS